MSQTDSGESEWKAGDVLASIYEAKTLVKFIATWKPDCFFHGMLCNCKQESHYFRKENFRLVCQICHAATGGARWCAEHEPKTCDECDPSFACWTDKSQCRKPSDLRGTVVLPDHLKVIFTGTIPLQEPQCTCGPSSEPCPVHMANFRNGKPMPDLEAMARELAVKLTLYSLRGRTEILLKALQQVDAAARDAYQKQLEINNAQWEIYIAWAYL